MPRPKIPLSKQRSSHQLRIIGGKWRSRRVPIADVAGLRPTPDRVRETLFNWLQFEIASATVLDLFAGSGALGLEALSRGASEVTFIEKHPKAYAQLSTNVATLHTDTEPARVDLRQMDAWAFLQAAPVKPYAIIFLDPPFRQAWLTKLLPLLFERGWLQAAGWLYLEYEEGATVDWSSFPVELYRQTTAGQVVSVLLKNKP